MKPRPRTIDILKAAGYIYGVKPEYITQDTQKRGVVRIRQVAHYLARLMTNLSLEEIGNRMGGRDHATVLHSIKRVNNDYNLYDDTRYLVDNITHWLSDEGFCVKSNDQLLRERLEKEHQKHNEVWQQISTEKQGTTSSAML